MRKLTVFLFLAITFTAFASLRVKKSVNSSQAAELQGNVPAVSQEARAWFDKGKWKHGWKVGAFADIDVQTFYEQYCKSPAMYDSIFTWLASIDPLTMQPSNKAMQWSHAYAKVLNQQLRTPENCQWEQHRRTIDLQWDVTGSERYHITRLPQRLEPKNEYSEKKDVQNFTWDKKNPPTPGECRILDSNPHTFYLFFPNDIHQACGIAVEPCVPRKVVVKIDWQ